MSFAIELTTALDPKHIKGSVANLGILGVQMGVIVIGDDNISVAQKDARKYTKMSPHKVMQHPVARVTGTVSEAPQQTRILIMTKSEVREWAAIVRDGTAHT